jgi:hypothetical protein
LQEDKVECQRTMNERTIKIEYFRFCLDQTPELIVLDCVDDCINLVYIIQELIFPANGTGKVLPDTGF